MLKRSLLLLLLANGMSLVAMEPNQPSLLTRVKSWLTNRPATEQEVFGGYFVRIEKMPTQMPTNKGEHEQLLNEVGIDFAQKYQQYALSGTKEANILNNRINTFVENHINFLNKHSTQEAADFTARKQVLNKIIQEILVQQKYKARL